MPYPDTVATFTYYLTQIRAMNPAYVQLVRYASILDEPSPLSTSEKPLKRGTPHDVLTVYGPIIKPAPSTLADHTIESFLGSALPPVGASANPTPTRLLLNAGLSPDEADKLIAEDKIDGAVFGFLWISNPDLQARAEKGIAPSFQVDLSKLYGLPTGEKLAEGYSDYPFAT